MSNSKEKQRLLKLLKITGAVFGAMLLVLGVFYLVSLLMAKDKVDYTEKQEGIYYFSVDYEENILEDLVYAAKNRNIMFTDHLGNGELLTAELAEEKNDKALMYNYFKALMEGDATLHEALLSTNYKKHFYVHKSFTPQKVYDIDVRFLTGGTENGVYTDKYQVAYKIYENNGTYRADVGSGVAKLMVFELVKEDGAVKINSIVPMNIK